METSFIYRRPVLREYLVRIIDPETGSSMERLVIAINAIIAKEKAMSDNPGCHCFVMMEISG